MDNIVFLFIMIIDLFIPFFIAIPYKGYSHSKMVMSILGCKNSPLANIYNIWTIISGFGISFYGYKIFKYYSNENLKLAITIYILILLYGIFDEIVSGIFPLNEKKEDVTFSSKVHDVGSTIGFIAFQFAPLFLSILEFKAGRLIMGYISIISFILSLSASIFFIIGEKPQFKNRFGGLEGLWQRVLCFFMYVPFIVWTIQKIN